MTPAIGLLLIGAILLKAGFQNKNIMDVVLGREGENPGGRVPTLPASSLGMTEPELSSDIASGRGNLSVRGLSHFDGHPVAAWIVPVLKWARKNGWKGRVTSGYRTIAEQTAIYNDPNHKGPVAKPGQSNHQKKDYPGGAVDVSDSATLQRLVGRYPGPGPTLKWFGPGDSVHFSGDGH